jgi:6-phosphofructokinase 1
MLCGGDAPGLNSVIRSATLAALQRGWEVIGIRDGFNGLMFPEDYVESGGTITLTREFVRGTGHLGGTVMGSTIRGNPCAYPVQLDDGSGGTVDRTDELVGLFREAGIEALITIGGDGSLAIGQRLSEAGLRVVGVPKTIDNDLLMTDATFGFDTAVGVATESIDRLFTTATSHSRVFVVEVMGRYAGWIALNAGMAARAHALVASTTEPRATVKGADNLAIERKSGRRNGYARYRQLRPVAHLAP